MASRALGIGVTKKHEFVACPRKVENLGVIFDAEGCPTAAGTVSRPVGEAAGDWRPGDARVPARGQLRPHGKRVTSQGGDRRSSSVHRGPHGRHDPQGLTAGIGRATDSRSLCTV